MAFTLFSCAQEEVMLDEKGPKHEVSLTMSFTLASDLDTRATRPLESIDAWQRVTNMRVYVFRSNDGEEGPFNLYYPEIKGANGELQKLNYFHIPEFDKGYGDENIWKEPEDEQYEYTISPMLDEGYYRFLAVGFDDPELSPVKLNWTEETTWEKAILSNSGNTPDASEIFTGYPRNADGEVETIKIDSKTKELSKEIKCRRAVAGVLLYLKNIPVKCKAEHDWYGDEIGTGNAGPTIIKGTECDIHEVALVTVGHNSNCNAVSRLWENDFKLDNSGFRLTRLAWFELDPEGEEVNNGYHEKIFPAVGNFVMPSETSTVKEKPLIIKSEDEFWTPQTLTFDKSLYLCFFTKIGNDYYPVKFWPVKLVRSNIQDEESEDFCAGDLNLQPDNPFNYNLVANHLYCLGMKGETIDKPVDLKKEEEEHGDDPLKIVVIGNWQYEINIEM